jgi:spoIIIJ-associated protein
VKPQLDDFLKRLLKMAGLELAFNIAEPAPTPGDPEAPELMVDFSGPDTDLLLQRGGELLEALEDVSARFLRLPQEERGRIVFDSMDYRMLRVEELRLTAQTAAEKVLSSGAPFSLNPMNSRERRIVHLALKDNCSVRTESQGFGSNRKVVISPAEKK